MPGRSSTPAVPTSPRDPLGILGATALVMRQAESVRIDEDAIARMATAFIDQAVAIPPWDATLHYRGHAGPDDQAGAARTAGWVFALDALNFCFWAQGPDPDDRWRVAWHGTIHNGYDALAAALSRAVEDGHPLWDAAWLASVSESTLRNILRPVPGSPEIPLFPERLHTLRELGSALLDVPGDGELPPVVRLIHRASGSAAT
ncbi:MAG: queuosine salvage family protein, partial [Thermomicrobiales bacterium]